MVASNNLQLQEACSVFLSNKELSISYVYLLNRLIQNIEIIHESRHLISTGIKTHLPFRNQHRVKCHKIKLIYSQFQFTFHRAIPKFVRNFRSTFHIWEVGRELHDELLDELRNEFANFTMNSVMNSQRSSQV